MSHYCDTRAGVMQAACSLHYDRTQPAYDRVQVAYTIVFIGG